MLEKIEIDSRQRSRGYGSTVIERLRQKARDEGCRELVINNVRASNLRAISLYEALGAKAQGEWVRYRLTGEALLNLAREGGQD